MTQPKAYSVPMAVDITQASGAALADLLTANERGDIGALIGVDIVVTYSERRKWQKDADWLQFRAEGGMTREVMSHFLFFTKCVVEPLALVSAHTVYPNDPLVSENAVLARLASSKGQQASKLATVGRIQPDGKKFIEKGTITSLRVTDFHKGTVSNSGDFFALRTPSKDQRATGLKDRLINLSPHLSGKSNKLATID